jgi:hypothetical protein
MTSLSNVAVVISAIIWKPVFLLISWTIGVVPCMKLIRRVCRRRLQSPQSSPMMSGTPVLRVSPQMRQNLSHWQLRSEELDDGINEDEIEDIEVETKWIHDVIYALEARL